VGGFNGTDPSPTLEQFQRYVADGQVHYFLDAHNDLARMRGRAASGSQEASTITTWVHDHFTPLRIEGAVLYDLTQARRDS
jgi:hypothetical protein